MMEKREQYKRLVKFLSSVLILAMLTAVFAYIWFLCYADNKEALIKPFWRRGNYVLIGLYTLMMYLFYKVFGGFKVGYLRLFEMIYSQAISVVCVNAITYLQLCLIGRWGFLEYILPIVYMTAIDLILVITWGFISQRIFFKIYPPRKMVMVYGKYNPDFLLRKMATRKDKYEITEVISIETDLEQIKAKIFEQRCVLLMDIPAEIRNELLKFCFENEIRCYCVPKISDIMVISAENIHLFDTSLLLMRNRGLTADQEMAKRAFDIVASAIAIILASPFMLLIALGIKLCDGGPVIFTQERLTKDGKVFQVKKFRSMYVEAGEGTNYLTRKDDDRVTPVGKLIRRIHFDELPQLFNILKGDMSFVGPRPECPDIAKEYSDSIPEFPYRLKVKAGLTGYAQVYGKYNTTPYDKLKLDLFYIENYSFVLDLKLMLMTFKILFLKDNTEGIEDWQTNALQHNDNVQV